MNPADKLLPRLRRVKKTGAGRWIASCPTREDKRPSLSIRQLDDGRLLVHDFGGEDVASVMAAVGLEVSDLFPPRATAFAGRTTKPFNAMDVLDLVSFETTVALVVCSDVLRDKTVSEEDFCRLQTAAQRLADAAEVCRGYR